MVNDLQSSMLTLIKRYVNRQAIVLKAMQDLRPDLVMRMEGRGTSKELAEMRLQYAQRPSTGLWGEDNQWEYRLHGVGCHLTHTKTGETIGWDIGSLNRFDWHWFVDYLQWLFQADNTNDDVHTVEKGLQVSTSDSDGLKDIVYNVLIELQENDYIKPAKASHRFILVEQK